MIDTKARNMELACSVGSWCEGPYDVDGAVAVGWRYGADRIELHGPSTTEVALVLNRRGW